MLLVSALSPQTPHAQRIVTSPISSPTSPCLFGPKNPYNPQTAQGREFLYFRSHLANPGAIDQWIQANLSSWPRNDPRAVADMLYMEEVICDVEMGLLPARFKPSAHHEDPFMDAFDNERFVLYLTVMIPDDPSLPLWLRKSPRVLIDRFVGAQSEIRAPDWCRSLALGQQVSFLQPRCGISDFVAKLAVSSHNSDEGLSGRILNWVEDVVISSIASARKLAENPNAHSTVPSRPSRALNFRHHRHRTVKGRPRARSESPGAHLTGIAVGSFHT